MNDSYLLPRKKCQSIASDVHDLLRGFLIEHKDTYELHDLAFQDRLPVIAPIQDFFQYVARERTGNKAPLSQSLIWPTNILGIRWEDPPGKGPAAAWLFKRGALPTIVYDADMISTKVGLEHRNRLINRLVLHEIGHTWLHWDELGKNAKGGLIPSASNVHECEAWFFSSVVMGLATGSNANLCRKSKGPDDAWLLVG